ncbi:MAG: MBOAT family protein [Muribaculaceae bacterium]|jgi:D-alanyl-lipoteichoic acid acyltransferase DltB (MBOAT superfamily)|nr:MBOAT family protein [Muribaculaceae bacterium]
MNHLLSQISQLLAYDPASPMLFNTGMFMVLFVIFMFLYLLVRGYRVVKMLLVIAFSLYFYYKSGSWCVYILCGVCVSDYVLGLLLGWFKRDILRRAVVALNVLVNVGMLVYFKYFNLLYEAFCSIVSTSFEPLDVILPAGISFFTFRSISYIVDVYRGDMKPCRNFLDYFFFLTFFPPLLAGPVVRARDMLGQIRENPSATREMISEGLFLIMTGLVKKVMIADYISTNFVDRIFDNPALYSGFENLMGAIGFTVQLYCDFSGYSDMAIGLALLMGYRFKINFDAPFKSQSPTEFWRRWHISLSTWLRDYVYIPLGGNRRGRARAYFNQFITMVIGGFWHGAAWMYVIWGAYHGLLLVAHKALRSMWKLPEWLVGRPEIKALNVALTFMLVVVGFTLFRAPDLETVALMGSQILGDFHMSVLPQFVEGYMLIVGALVVSMVAHFTPRSWTTGTAKIYDVLPIAFQAAVLAIVIFLVIQTRQSEIVPFIYLQY